MTQELQQMISGLVPLDDVERQHIDYTLAWIDSGAPLYRTAKPATPDPHLVSYFLLVDGDHVLLVDHINAGLWLPTGGHVEPHEHPTETVYREALEELRIDADLKFPDPVFVSVSQTVGRTAGHTDVCLWFALQGNREQPLDFDTGEFRSVRWFHRAEIPLDRTDPHLGRFIKKLTQMCGT